MLNSLAWSFYVPVVSLELLSVCNASCFLFHMFVVGPQSFLYWLVFPTIQRIGLISILSESTANYWALVQLDCTKCAKEPSFSYFYLLYLLHSGLYDSDSVKLVWPSCTVEQRYRAPFFWLLISSLCDKFFWSFAIFLLVLLVVFCACYSYLIAVFPEFTFLSYMYGSETIKFFFLVLYFIYLDSEVLKSACCRVVFVFS